METRTTFRTSMTRDLRLRAGGGEIPIIVGLRRGPPTRTIASRSPRGAIRRPGDRNGPNPATIRALGSRSRREAVSADASDPTSVAR